MMSATSTDSVLAVIIDKSLDAYALLEENPVHPQLSKSFTRHKMRIVKHN